MQAMIGPATNAHARTRPVGPRRVALAAAMMAFAFTAVSFADEVRVTGVDYLGDLPTRVADHNNLFAAQGIDARVAYSASGHDNLRALRAGDTDFALMALTPLAVDLAADHDPREANDPVILASVVHSTRLHQVVALGDGGYLAPANLAGRRIGLMRGTSAEFVWSLFAAYHGLDPAGVEIIDGPIESLAGALAGGRIDAAVLWEPWTGRLRARVGDRLTEFTGSNIYTAKWVLVTRREFANEQPALARGVLRAYQAAIDVIRRDPDGTVAAYTAEADAESGNLQRHRDAILYGLNLDWSLLASLRQQFEWALEAGYGAATPERDVLARIDTRPLRAIVPSAIGIPYTDRGAGPLERRP